MNSFLKQSTASQSRAIGPFLDDTDFKTPETGLTVNASDIKLVVNGAASANKNSGGGTHRVNGVYGITFDATDTATVGEMHVSAVVTGALPVFHTFVVLEEAVYDALFAASAPGYLQPTTAGRTLDVSATGEAGVDWANVGSPTTAVNLSGTNIKTDQVVASVTGSVGSVVGAVGSVTGAVGSVTGNVGGNVVGSVASVTGNVGGNVTGSVGSVVGAVGSVTGAVGSVTGNVGGNVVGSVASVTGAVGSVTGNVGGNVTGSVGSVVGAVGSVSGAVGSVTGNVGGNVVGSTASVTGAVGSVTGNVGGNLLGTLTAAERNAIADANLDRADAVEVGLTPRQASRLIAAATAGKLSGAATTTATIRNAVADSKNRIVATVDSDGNRTAVTVDVS